MSANMSAYMDSLAASVRAEEEYQRGYEKRSASRRAAHKAEIEAILALCHHGNSFDADCESCVFRQQIVVDHLQRVVAEVVACLSGLHASCNCEEEDNYRIRLGLDPQNNRKGPL